MVSPPWKLFSCWVGFLVAFVSGGVSPAGGQVPPRLPQHQGSSAPVWTRKLDLALYSIAWTSDGRTLAAGGRNTIWLYHCPDFFEQAQLRADQGEVSGLAWSPDDHTLASGGRDGVIRLWVDGNVERRLTQGTWVLDLGWEPKAGVLAAVDESGLVKLWDRAGTPQASIQLDGNGLALDWSPKGNFLAVSTGQEGSSLCAIEVSQAQIRWQRKNVPPFYNAPFGYGQDEVNGVAYSPDGRLIASTHQDGSLVIWQADSGRRLTSVQVHGSGVAGARRVTWSPDQSWLCTCGEDGEVNLVPYPKMNYRIQILDSSRPIWAVRFSPDGKYLAAVGDTGEIWVWEVPKGERPSARPRLAASPSRHHRAGRSARVAHRPAEPKRRWWFW